MLAASLAFLDMVELLINNGANVNFQKGNNSSVGVNPLYTPTLISLFSILYCIHFLRL